MAQISGRIAHLQRRAGIPRIPAAGKGFGGIRFRAQLWFLRTNCERFLLSTETALLTKSTVDRSRVSSNDYVASAYRRRSRMSFCPRANVRRRRRTAWVVQTSGAWNVGRCRPPATSYTLCPRSYYRRRRPRAYGDRWCVRPAPSAGSPCVAKSEARLRIA